MTDETHCVSVLQMCELDLQTAHSGIGHTRGATYCNQLRQDAIRVILIRSLIMHVDLLLSSAKVQSKYTLPINTHSRRNIQNLLGIFRGGKIVKSYPVSFKTLNLNSNDVRAPISSLIYRLICYDNGGESKIFAFC